MDRDEVLRRIASGSMPVAQALELLSKGNPAPKPAKAKQPPVRAAVTIEWPVWCERRDGAVPHPTSRIVSDTEVVQAVGRKWIGVPDALELLSQ